MNSLQQSLRDLIALSKPGIVIMCLVEASGGLWLAPGTAPLAIWLWTFLGLSLVVASSNAWNMLWERESDKFMERTRNRPLPSGRMKPATAGLFALVTGVASVWLFATQVNALSAWLALASMFSYVLVYTPLKRVTPFAALPGALIGALPPAMGWVAAGGYLQDPSIHLVAFFFFLWQIPHFWLLLLFYAQDYQGGGLPSLLDRFGRAQVLRLTFLWIAAVSAAALLLPLTPLFETPALAYVLAAAGALLVWRAAALLRSAAPAPFRRLCRLRFMEINTFALLVCVLLVADALIVPAR